MAMEYNQLASSLAPDDDSFKVELSQTHANLAGAWLDVCNLGGALESQLANVSFAVEFYEGQLNNRLKEQYAYSLSSLARVQFRVGLGAMAQQSLEHSVELLNELSRQDPSNINFRWNLYRKSMRLANIIGILGNESKAWEMSSEIERELRKLEKEDRSISMVNGVVIAEFLRNYSDLAWHRGESDLARRLLNENTERLNQLLAAHADSKTALYQLGLAGFSQWQHSGEPINVQGLSPGLMDKVEVRGCDEANLAARQAVQHGDKSAAEHYTSYLLAKGYFEPGFIRFCRRYELCD